MDLLKAFHNPDAQVGSSSFDLSCRRIFSSKAGQLVPALVLDTVPGDKFQINLDALMRSNTLDTAAFIRGKFNYDFFFVPYQQVWHRFLEFVNQKVDLHTASYNGRQVPYAPSIRLRDLVKLYAYALISAKTGDDDYHVLNDLGDFPYGVDSQGAQDIINQSWINDSIKLLNHLGYGDFSELLTRFDLTDATVIQDIIQDTGSFAQWLDELCGDGMSINPYIYINPFRLCAYQHIWYDVYRNKYFDVPDQNHEYEKSFNLDDINCTSLASSRIFPNNDPVRFLRMTMLHYCQWKKDIYTSLVPSQQFGVVSSIDVTPNLPFNINDTRYVTVGTNSSSFGFTDVISSGSTLNPLRQGVINMHSDFDVLTLRRAEALQKWKESAVRAGNLSPNNQRAHFGVDPFYYEDNEVHFLGSYDGVFQVNPVAASSAASSSLNNHNVGDLAATGTSVVTKNNNIEFECRDYGVLMCISRFVPESEYSATGIEKSNTRFEPFDYYNPEFASLGLQAVPLIEQENSHVFSDAQGKNFVLGYAPRDYDYKQMQDKVYGQFMNRMSSSVSREYGVFSNWVSPRVENLVSIDQGVPNGRAISSFYVDPRIFDRVFLINADYSESDDQFLHQCYFNVKAIRKMPVLGLPEF